MTQKTPLYEQHVQAGGKMVDFAGWDMPLHYGSQIEEHKQVRQDAGMFDVSHMNPVDVQGPQAKDFLRYLLANDVNKISPGKALYSCMLNETGGVIDDLIVYQLSENNYRLVLNAGTRAKDMTWLQQQGHNFNVNIKQRPDLAIIAIQGPQARNKVHQVFSAVQKAAVQNLKPFELAMTDNWLIARTGYTGEDGYEVILPIANVVNFWQALLNAGVKPCGLGARDTLRLEAGMNLYGTDMDESTSPLESNLAWTVAWNPAERNFVGRVALATQQQHGIKRRLVGLVLKERGILRNHQTVIVDGGKGEITSGSFSPTLDYSIALARVPATVGDHCYVEVRDKRLAAEIVKPPFVRQGKKVSSSR